MVAYNTSVAPTPTVTSVSQFKVRLRVVEYLVRQKFQGEGKIDKVERGETSPDEN